MQNFTIPAKDQVSQSNLSIFESVEKSLGFVPNLYAYIANNDTALGDYLTLQNRKSTLSAKEREVINLIVSQINNCHYCLSAHTVLGKLNGFSDEQILEIRKGDATFDSKLNALLQFAKEVTQNRGKATQESKDAFFEAGYSEANLIDAIMIIGDKIISNYIHNVADFAIDFPVATKI
jgi:uncharacterized peroxidase-related enzyme